MAGIEHEVGPVDVLVNNAGYGHEGLLEESSLEELRRQFDANVYGVIYCTHAAIGHLLERGSGHVVTVSSGAGRL